MRNWSITRSIQAATLVVSTVGTSWIYIQMHDILPLLLLGSAVFGMAVGDITARGMSLLANKRWFSGALCLLLGGGVLGYIAAQQFGFVDLTGNSVGRVLTLALNMFIDFFALWGMAFYAFARLERRRSSNSLQTGQN